MTGPEHKGRHKSGARTSTADYLDAINRAASLYRAGQLEQAERLCLDLLEIQSGEFNASHLLGLVKLERGSAAEAIVYFDQALHAGRMLTRFSTIAATHSKHSIATRQRSRVTIWRSRSSRTTRRR